ncbi:penicillin-binding protein 1A [Alphaproteobacteria bacterium]|nr:penicillin-binding protein 1A [Alphaproteobacteria bacterium]
MSIKRAVRRFLCFVIVAAILGTAALLITLHYFSLELPDHTSLKKYAPDVASRVFLEDGSKLCEYSYEKRYFIPIEKVPQKLINAFLAAEDKRFYEHMGVDFMRVARSAIRNLQQLGTGKRPQGASTITQQVARIFLIKNNEVSYVRKIKEAILSYRIEMALSKQSILELYLNQIYLGVGAHGVAAAAKIYFDKTVDELTTAQCAYLASLAKGANNYHPVKNKKKAIERRNWLIDRMLEDGFIEKNDAEKAKLEKLEMVPSEKTANAEYLSEEIRKHLMEKFPSCSLNTDGLIIRGTMDARLQNIAYESLRKGLENVDRAFGWRGPIGEIDMDDADDDDDIVSELKTIEAPAGSGEFRKALVTEKGKKKISIITENGKTGEIVDADAKWMGAKVNVGDVILVSKVKDGANKKSKTYNVRQVPLVQGAIVVMEVNTGRVLAMQGGYDFSISEFNRATQAMRQCGSVFKPFAYLAALENGFSPNSIIDSGSVEIDTGAASVWRPRNYHGALVEKVTLRRAVEKSINTATVRMSEEVGIDKIAETANQFRIFDNMPELLSYALGAGETTLLRITAAYAMIANGGKRITPTMVDYVQDKRGNTIYRITDESYDSDEEFDVEYPPKLNDARQQILSEQSIYQMISLLEGVIQRGSGGSAKVLGIPVAGKTGTSNESRDTWFIGFTPDIAVGVFVGFDDHSKGLGRNATGASTALPIFISFMAEAKKFFAPKPFRVPHGIKLRKIDLETGGPPSPSGNGSIMEAFKEDEYDGKNDVKSSTSNSILQRLSAEGALDVLSPKDDAFDNRDEEYTGDKSIFGIY